MLFAVTSAALLAVIGLLYSFGLVLSQRRVLQTAADAASLSGAWQVVAELRSDDRSDARVYAAALRYASSNGVNNASDVALVYVAADGTALGRGEPFPVLARGVRVTVSGRSTTVLPAFVGASSILEQTTATAIARATASPTPDTQVIPIGVDQADFSPHAQVDLLQASRRAVLDLRSAGAPDAGVMSANLQLWSDGQHATGSVAVGQTLPAVSGSYGESLAAGLSDNVRRQNLRDASGAQFGIVSVPIYASGSSPPRIVGFARLKLRATDVSPASAPGLFVPYSADAYGTPDLTRPDFGAILVSLTS